MTIIEVVEQLGQNAVRELIINNREVEILHQEEELQAPLNVLDGLEVWS